MELKQSAVKCFSFFSLRRCFQALLVLVLIGGVVAGSRLTSSSCGLEEAREVMEPRMIAAITQVETLNGGIKKYRAMRPDGTPLTQLEVIQLWADEAKGEEYREDIRSVLVGQDSDAFFWECTPTNEHVIGRTPFEFVVVPAPSLSSKQPDTASFQSHFSGPCSFATFLNLGKDAVLVSPSPCDGRDYAHLARFVKSAPPEHGRELFKHVGKAVLNNLGPNPMWLSTSGAGVYWLHVRLDSYPKYYSFSAYRQPPAS